MPKVADQYVEGREVEAPKVDTKFQKVNRTLTNWGVFVKAQLVPKRVVCEGYLPTHRYDSGCHSNLLLTAEAVERHLDADHGGGYRLFLRKGDIPWKGWLEFQDKGLEIHDFRCEICDAELPMSAGHILKHFESHTGKMKRSKPGGEFLMTIRKDKPLTSEDVTE